MIKRSYRHNICICMFRQDICFRKKHKNKQNKSFAAGLRTDLNEQRTNDQFQEPYNEEQIISLLPSLEVASRISGGSQDDQIVQLARFSEIKSAPTAVKHSLKLLEHLLRKVERINLFWRFYNVSVAQSVSVSVSVIEF